MKSLLPLLCAFIVGMLHVTYSKTIIVPEHHHNIQKALDEAQKGDTILVKNGIYKESVTLRNNVTLMGENASGVVIQGNGRKPVVTAAHRAIIKNLTIEKGSKGILCENTKSIIENTIIRNNKETGIHCLITLPAIRNNVIYRNRWSGIYCESVRGLENDISHNVIAENGYSGLVLSGRSEVLLQNNVFFGNKQYGIWVDKQSAKSRIRHNDFFNNRTRSNPLAHIDHSNVAIDPMYPMTKDGYYKYSGGESAQLQGKGADGVTIGLISEATLTDLLSDSDKDSIMGDNDDCPNMAEDNDGFEDDDGCPDFDNDGDGIYDTHDKCPNEAEDADDFEDSDGCPDPDNDNDGIEDQLDACPKKPEVKNGYKDDDGCPDEVPPEGAGDPMKTEDK